MKAESGSWGVPAGNNFTGWRVVPGTMSEKECSIWQGRPQFYQEQALLAVVEAGVRIWPWSWIETTCGEELCLEPDHLVVNGPQKLKYPAGQCVYCGVIAQSKDHIVPTAATGIEHRKYVLTVPACLQCNGAINDVPVYSIDGRRRVAQAYIAKKYKSALSRPEYTREEIQEFEGRLRQAIMGDQEEKAYLRARLTWPEDPFYDLRYLQKSGIEDPYLTGLLSPSDDL